MAASEMVERLFVTSTNGRGQRCRLGWLRESRVGGVVRQGAYWRVFFASASAAAFSSAR
jgi:hypothetical protein